MPWRHGREAMHGSMLPKKAKLPLLGNWPFSLLLPTLVLFSLFQLMVSGGKAMPFVNIKITKEGATKSTKRGVDFRRYNSSAAGIR